MEKPVWLLDIDGVINALGSEFACATAWPGDDWHSGWATAADGDKFWITAAEPVLEFIRRVHEEGLAEIRWLTTWRGAAVNVARLLNLPRFPCQQEYPSSTGAQKERAHYVWWKQPCAEHVVEVEQRSLVWTDDDLHRELSIKARHKLQKAGALLVRPDDITGLGPADLTRIENYCRASVIPL